MQQSHSEVLNEKLFDLNNNGSLKPRNEQEDPGSQNVNFFNIDMVYTWQFAPGSFMNIVWKNSIFTNSSEHELYYFDNLSETLGSDQNNNLSVKLIYFLDYQKLKRV